MFGWAITFLIMTIIVGVTGFSEMAGTASSIILVCDLIGIVLALMFFINYRKHRI